jgi:GNAT superfamily N-acetyltransferase
MDALILPLEKEHLPEARRVFRLAFGTFLGLPDPMKFAPGVDFHGWRREMFPEGAWGAFEGDRLIGSVITSRWGSFGFFGPLTIDPEFWDKGIGQRLLEPTMDCLKAWDTRLDGLFTFSASPKHLTLYHRYGFHPGHLIAIMGKRIEPRSTETLQEYQAFSRLPEEMRTAMLASCRELTDAIYPGLDVTAEIQSVADHKLGETLLLGEGTDVEALAICHQGTGTEGGTAGTYVKFGAVRPGKEAGATFDRMMPACESYARMKGAPSLYLGMNTGRKEAYGALLRAGYRINALGVAMHRGANGHYHRESDFVIEDLR